MAYRKDQGGHYYCHKYRANGCGVSWQLGEDKGISLQTHSLVLQAFLPTQVSTPTFVLTCFWWLDISDSLSHIPRYHILTVTHSLFFLPHPTQFIVLHSYLLPALVQLFSFLWHWSSRNKSQTLSFFVSSFLPLPPSLFLPPLLPSLHSLSIKSLRFLRTALCSWIPTPPIPSWAPVPSHPSTGWCPVLLDCCASLGNSGQPPPQLPHPGLLGDTRSHQHWAGRHLAESLGASACPSSTSPIWALDESQRHGTPTTDGQARDWGLWTPKPLASLERKEEEK